MVTPYMPKDVTVAIEWLGRVPYRQALAMQFAYADRRRRNLIPDTILLVEHPAVITQGLRASDAHILADDAQLSYEGIAIEKVTRGGQTTYHGIGQLVGYVIVDVSARLRDVTALTSGIEQAIISYLATHSVVGAVNAQHPGVWCNDKKIAAIGLAIHNKITMHGFALNICPVLTHFSYIVACGLTGNIHTSLVVERPELVGAVDVERAQQDIRPFLNDFYISYKKGAATR